MKKIIGLITLLAGLPGLAGIYLRWKLGGLPPGAVFIVVNAVLSRCVCGTAGGVLLLTRYPVTPNIKNILNPFLRSERIK